MEMTIPIVCLRSCSANVCPHIDSHVWQRGCFSNWIQNIKLVVLAVYIAPFLSQSNKTLPNTCFASEPYSLSMVRLETFQSCWFHECIYTPAETTKLCFSQPRSVPRGRIRPVTRILFGGVLTRPKWTKLPKCIFYFLIRLFRKVAIHEKL